MSWDHEAIDFRRRVRDAEAAIKERDYTRAREQIAAAMAMDMDAPEPHNLLGILNELTGDYTAARRHYRAAYALCPSYRPSCRNLERISAIDFRSTLAEVVFSETIGMQVMAGAH